MLCHVGRGNSKMPLTARPVVELAGHFFGGKGRWKRGVMGGEVIHEKRWSHGMRGGFCRICIQRFCLSWGRHCRKGPSLRWFRLRRLAWSKSVIWGGRREEEWGAWTSAGRSNVGEFGRWYGSCREQQESLEVWNCVFVCCSWSLCERRAAW